MKQNHRTDTRSAIEVKKQFLTLPASAAVLAAVNDHTAVLRDPHSVGQNLVLQQIRRLMTVTL
jgi:hypothetical protein